MTKRNAQLDDIPCGGFAALLHP